MAWNTFNTQIGSYLLEVLVKNTGSLAAYDTFTTIPYAMQLCNSPTLSTLPATSPYVSGSGAITLTANGTCQGTTEFAFFYKDPGGVFHVIQGYSTAKTAPWAADFKAGDYQLLVEIRPQGSGLPYVMFLYMPFTLSGCANATLSPSVASPQVAGDTVTFTASGTCSGTATFSFWVLSPGGVWTNARPYGTGNTFAWASPTTNGTYLVEVLARNSGAVEDPYDSFSAIPNYMLGLCSAATLNTSAPSIYRSGSGPITLTGGGHCAGGTEFQFYYQDLAGGFHLIQAYSATATAPWPADFKAGTYPLLVELRPTGSSAAYVTFLYKPFTLTGCDTPNLAPDKASPQVGGTVVTFTATVTCTGTPSYSFWVLSPSSVWTNAQPYGASSTFAWSSPTAPGAYLVEVLVRNNGAGEDPYDSFLAITNYMLVLCSPATLSTGGATTPYVSGLGPITLTGGGNCAGGTQFQFYFQDPAGGFQLIQAYGASNTASFNADYKAGDYKLLVELRPTGSSAAFVTYLYVPFTLSGCGPVTLAPDLSSPRPRTTTITWTATVTCTGTATYQFWVVYPDGTFHMVQDYSVSSTFAWTGTNQPTTGNYTVEVLVRNSGANHDPYDNYKTVNYMLS